MLHVRKKLHSGAVGQHCDGHVMWLGHILAEMRLHLVTEKRLRQKDEERCTGRTEWCFPKDAGVMKDRG